MAYKMKGFSGFKGSPAKKELIGGQKNLPDGLKAKIEAAPGKMYDSPAKQKNKGKMQGPIPEQNLKLQPSENDGTWIYGRGYEGEDPKEGIKEMKATEKRLNKKNARNDPKGGTKFVRSERINDYDERAGSIEQNDLQNSDEYLGGGDKEKGAKKRKQLKKTVKTLDREAQIMRDRTPAKKSPGKMYGKKSPAKQTKFPNSPKAKKRKMVKGLKEAFKDFYTEPFVGPKTPNHISPKMDPKMVKKLNEMMKKKKK